MWSKKWYLKRNISYDTDLLNELLETDVPWDDAILVWAGKVRKLWNFLSELCSCVCERRLEKTVLSPALFPVKTAQFTQFFRQVCHTLKLLSLTESAKGALVFHPSGIVTHLIRSLIGTMADRVDLPFCCQTPVPSRLSSIQPVFITERKEHKISSRNKFQKMALFYSIETPPLCWTQINTFTAIVDLSRFNNSCLKSRQRRP